MTEERREGYAKLERKVEDHIARFDDFEEDLLTVIAGQKDPLTKQRTGGLRGEMGQMRLEMTDFNVRSANGGINTKWSFWQRVTIASIGPISVGAFAIVQSLLETK